MNANSPTSIIAIVASRKGAPMIAPIATSSAPSAPPRMVITGMIVSGIAVPTAAIRLPAAPSPSESLWPVHSTALVKSCAPARITAKLANRRIASIARTYPHPRGSRREEGDREDHVDGEELHALEPRRLPLLRDV